MIYVVEAVRWNEAGSVSHVRWHPIELDNEKLVHGKSVVVPVEIAIEEAKRTAVHICHDGAPGSKLAVRTSPKGSLLVDGPAAPAGQTLQVMPTF